MSEIQHGGRFPELNAIKPIRNLASETPNSLPHDTHIPWEGLEKNGMTNAVKSGTHWRVNKGSRLVSYSKQLLYWLVYFIGDVHQGGCFLYTLHCVHTKNRLWLSFINRPLCFLCQFNSNFHGGAFFVYKNRKVWEGGCFFYFFF